MSEWVKSERQLDRERVRKSRGRRSASVATASTIIFIVLVVLGVTNSPGWPRVRETFFNPAEFSKYVNTVNLCVKIPSPEELVIRNSRATRITVEISTITPTFNCDHLTSCWLGISLL